MKPVNHLLPKSKISRITDQPGKSGTKKVDEIPRSLDSRIF